MTYSVEQKFIWLNHMNSNKRKVSMKGKLNRKCNDKLIKTIDFHSGHPFTTILSDLYHTLHF